MAALSLWFLLRFNPFFIRASVYCVAVFKWRNNQGCVSFNPFFIRASVYWEVMERARIDVQFSFNPFFIRASVYWKITPPHQTIHNTFQSLLHQGISLLLGNKKGWNFSIFCVSIPSSSGHQFTECRYSRRNPELVSFQSLLHQGISLLFCPASYRHRPNALVSIPSSSGHQFTVWRPRDTAQVFACVSIPSSSGHQFTAVQQLMHKHRLRLRFNPFFIRASVY